MTRILFVAIPALLTAFLLAALNIGCAAQAQVADEAAVKPLRLACRVANYGKFQDEALDHIKGLGLHYVFMSIPKPEEVDAVKQQLDAKGLKALVVRGDTDLSKEASVEELGVQFETCKRLGVEYMFLSPKRHDAPFEVIYDRLRKAGNLAAKNGVILVLETHPDLGTNGEVHVATMKAINHPSVRVNFDTANITYYNHDTDAVTELKNCMEYVATIEVKDHNGAFETWNFPALGEGIVDFPGVFKVLRDHGYSGPVTLEVEGVKGVEWSLEDIQQALEKSVNYLRGIERFE